MRYIASSLVVFGCLVFLVCLCGCRPDEPLHGGLREGEKPTPELVLGFDAYGDLVLFDAGTGEVQSRAAGGGGKARGVSVDGKGRAWVFEENEDGSGGEIRICGVSGEVIHSCGHAAWVDGTAALLAMDDGLWVFEDGPAGPRWKALRYGEVAEGAYAPRPVSVKEDAGAVEALTYGASGDRLEVWRAGREGDETTAVKSADLGAPSSAPPTTRFSWRDGETFLWDVADGELVVGRVESDSVLETTKLGVSASRIEAVSAIDGGFVVISTDKAWIVRGDKQAGQWPLSEVLAVPLPGLVSPARLFFSTDLLPIAEGALVATDRGVLSIDAKCGAMSERFAGDALRGPLAALPRGR